ncbi:hypothetical protein GLE_3842 [Lysobacter enzymogenes]|uniref:Uncharacterized protein n=1 Tax=Lysobacter enzymogenes TaxID=69 RepID=A0A0S2DL70_LYSEN|nr:hypothetical protein GLE_3842 [Lysobacter enzymogenes]
MGGTSVPMLSAQVAASGYEGIGAEAPPTTASTTNADRSFDPAAQIFGFCGRDFSPDAFRSDRCDRIQKRSGLKPLPQQQAPQTPTARSIPQRRSSASVGGTSVPTPFAQTSTLQPETTTSKPRRAYRPAEKRAIATSPPRSSGIPCASAHSEFARVLNFDFPFRPPISSATNLRRMRDAMHGCDVEPADLRLVVRDEGDSQSRRGHFDELRRHAQRHAGRALRRNTAIATTKRFKGMHSVAQAAVHASLPYTHAVGGSMRQRPPHSLEHPVPTA